MADNTPITPPADLAGLQSAYISGPTDKSFANGVLAKYNPAARKVNDISPFSGGITPVTSVPQGPAAARYPYYSPFSDNEELYAGYQPWLSKAGAGILKGAGLALSTFANGTLGLFAGTANAIEDGRFASFYDNEFSRTLDDWNKYMEDRFPNYYTHQETDAAWYSPKNLLTANFLFDKVIKNLGYSVGAIGAGMTYAGALRSIGLFSKVASAGGLARTAQLSEQLLASVPEMQRASAVTGAVTQVSREFLGRFSTLNTTQRLIAAGLSTVGEAGFEALWQLNDYRNHLISSYVKEKGVNPTGQDMEEINALSENAGNVLFGLNVALLSATNYVQLPKIVGSSYRAEKGTFNAAVREIGDVFFSKQAGKFLANLPASKAGKALQRAGNVAGLFFSPTEAFEELSQSAFNFGVNSYFDKARAGKDTDILNDLLGEGYRQALTTKEGLESLLIGGISGGIMQMRGRIKERGFTGTGGIRAVNTAAALTAFNEKLFSGFLKDTVGSVNRGAVLQAQRMEAIRRGDILESKELETDFTHNYLAPRVKYGRYDLVKDDIAQYRALASTEAGLGQLKDQGIITEQTSRQQLLSRLDNFERHADHVFLQYQALNTRYSGQKNKEGRLLYPGNVIDKMVYASSKVADYDGRIPALGQGLLTHNISVQPLLDTMTEKDLPDSAAIKQAIEQIDNLNVIGETREELRTGLRDLTELVLRRKHFLKEYDQIKAHPEDYTDKDYKAPDLPATGPLSIPQTDDSGAPVSFPVEPEKTYPLNEPLLREGNQLYTLPALSLHEQNLLGELRYTAPNGQPGFALPGELSGFNLLNPITGMEKGVLKTAMERQLDDTLKLDRFKDLVKPPAAASFEDKMQAVNALDNQELADELEKRFTAQIEKLKKVREKIRNLSADEKKLAALEAFFQQHAAQSGTIFTGDPEIDQLLASELARYEGAKKQISVLFKSSTSETTTLTGTGENDDFHRRANKFLNNLGTIPDRENIQVATVTYVNQGLLGLSGLIPEKVPGTDISSTDPDQGVIRLVFIRSDAKGDFFVDVDGNNLGPVGKKPDFNNLVYTTAPSTSLSWRNGETRYITAGAHAATEQTAKTYQDSWRVKRRELLAENLFHTYPFSVSRGFPDYSPDHSPQSVVGTLISDWQLNAPVIVIPTHQSGIHGDRPLGSIIHGEETVNLPLGRPVLQTATTLLALNNRKLTDREKKVLLKLVPLLARKAAGNGSIDNRIMDYLRGLVFWKAPETGKAAGAGQIWFSGGYLYLGNTGARVPFIDELIASSADFAQFLDGIFISANNFLLTQKSGVPFNEILDVAGDDSLMQVQWKSYQHFLLDNKYATTTDDTSGMDAVPRPAAEIPFTTDIVFPEAGTDKYAAPFQQKYIVLQNFDISGQPAAGPTATTDPVTSPAAAASTSSSAAQPAPPVFDPIITAGDFILDGKHMNTIYYKDKALAKVAATFTTGGVQFGAYEHLGKKELTEEGKQAVLELARIAINRAVVAEHERRSSFAPSDPSAAATAAADTAPVTMSPPSPDETKPTAEDIFKNLTPRRTGDDISGGHYRVLTTTGAITRQDIDAAVAYQQKVLPQIPLHIIENLILTTDGGYAWGVLRDNAIYLYRGAETGTGYHEVFEAVYHLFLSRKEQRQILGEFAGRDGTFTDRETGQVVSYHAATDHQAKEQMAEEFRVYNLHGIPPPGGRQRNFFKRLLDFITRLLLGKPLSIRGLFEKIGAGYYARMPVPYANRTAGQQYSRFIPALGTKFIHDTMQGVTALVFDKLFADNSNIVKFDEGSISFDQLYDEIFKRLEEHFTKTLPESLLADISDAGLDEAEAAKAKQLYADFIGQSWLPIKTNWQALTVINRDFLRPFQLIFENDEVQDELEAAINTTDKNNREYERNTLRINARKNASMAVKLLFATLTQTEQLTSADVADGTLRPPARKLSSLKLPLLVNYAAAFNRLLYTVAGTNGLNNILAKIKALARKDSTYIRLYNRLKTGAGYDNLSADDWKLLLKLYAVASKQQPDYLIQIKDETGRTYIASANDNLQAKQVISGWLNELKAHSGPDKLVFAANDRYLINTELLKKFDPGSVGGKIAFLEKIGISFTREGYSGLDSKSKAKFNDGAQRLYNQLVKSGDIATITGRALGISGQLTKLAEAYVTINGQTTEAQHFNIEGEPVQNLILNNYVSYILSDINQYGTLQELQAALPHLTDVFSESSLLLEKGGPLFDDNGNRRDDPLFISVIEGSKAVGNRPGVPTSALPLAARRMQEFNQNLNGIYNILIPADSKTEWCLNFDKQHYIPYSDFSNPGALSNKIYRIFKNYLLAEIKLAGLYEERKKIGAIEKQGKGLRFFKDILPDSLLKSVETPIAQRQDGRQWVDAHESQIRAAINEWLDKLVDGQFNFFSDYGIISADANDTYSFAGIDSDFADDHKIGTVLSQADIKNIIRFRTLNYAIHNTELHKVFFADPALYTDATKRIKSFLSGRETSYHTDPEFNQMAAVKLNRASQSIQLQPSDPGYHIFRDYMPTVTAADVEVVGSIALRQDLPQWLPEAYEKTNEADAQSWMRLAAYREMLHKAGGRWTDQMEKQYQYEHAYERVQREKGGSYAYSNTALKQADVQLLAAGNPHAATFYVTKPIGSGVKYGAVFMDMFLDKTSTMPMFYRLVEGTAMQQVYIQMQNQDVAYLITASGRKVGAEGLHRLYNPDGSVNPAAFNNRIHVPFKYYGIQVETSSHGSGQVRGTQLTKLATLDLMDNGVPIDATLSYEQWQAVSEEQKLEHSAIYRLVSRNRSILNALTASGYRKVLDSLGITETADGYHIADKQKVATFLAQEVMRRELPDNLRDAITLDPASGEFTIPLEALPNYKALKNIIYAVIDRNLLSPLMPGGPKVQVSSTLFERNGRQAVYKPGADAASQWTPVTDYESLTESEKATVRLTSSELKFYTPEAPYMEVLLPHWFKEKLQRSVGANTSDEQLLAYLNKVDSPLLTGIGFRIPTQDLGSIEHFRIKGFLPQEMGDTIIVPSEITVKAGSDFDIDKLNTYLRHFYIDSKGRPQAFTLFYADTNSDQGLTDIYEQLGLHKKRSSAEKQNMTDQASANLMEAIFGEGVPVSEREITTLEDFIAKNKGRDIYDLYSQYHPRALENEYITTLEQLVTLPENFQRLLKPNSADELKDLRNELYQAMGKPTLETKGNFSLLLDPMYMSEVRHNFLGGKSGVGIAALQQTGLALSQLTTVVLDPEGYAAKLTPEKLGFVQNMQILLPHNKITISGREYATLSATKDAVNRYISDKISAYINGYVDVAKDAFIIELGAGLNVAATYMFLEKVGVPTRDVIFFMNQPIIRDYLKAMEIAGLTRPVSTATDKVVSRVKSGYPSARAAYGPIETAGLKGNIERKGRGEKFTSEQNAVQQQILDEFLKYSVFADELFRLTQGFNYDTANFSESSLIFRKLDLTQKVRNTNLYSSVDKILESSFLGTVAEKLSQIARAMGQIFEFEQPALSAIQQQVLSAYSGFHVSEDDFVQVAARLQASFMDYITQVYGSGQLNTKIVPLLLSGGSVASHLAAVKGRLPKDSEIARNIVLGYLQPLYDDSSPAEPKNVRLTEKAYDAYTYNLYTEAMRELRDNIHTGDLYKELVAVSILQSGTRKSPISFTDIIPVEDYAPILKEVIPLLAGKSDLKNFADNYAFQRVYWWDEKVVPTLEPKQVQDMAGSWYPMYSVPPRLFRNLGVAGRGTYDFIQLNSHFQARELNYPVVKIRQIAINPSTRAPYTLSEQAQMRKNGDYSFLSYKLYQQVRQLDAGGNMSALTYPAGDRKRPWAVLAIYKQINAWGKPGLVQEYYSTIRPSVLPSNIKVDEFTDGQVVAAFNNTGDLFLQRDEKISKVPLPSKAAAGTTEKVLKFLKRIGVDVKKVHQVVVNGRRLDASAVSDITRRLIQVVDGRQDTALTEEAMHFAVEILEQIDPRLFNLLLNEISRYQLFGQVLTDYRNDPLYLKEGKPDIRKIKKEAIARVLTETVVNKNEGTTEKPELLARTATWWEKIVDFLKGLFNIAGYNPFEKTAEKILGDTFDGTAAELPDQQDNIYLQRATSHKQSALAEKLLNIHRQLSKVTDPGAPTDSYYMLAGKKVANRVTNLSKKYYNEKFRNKQISETEAQKAINDQKREKGVDGHSDLEDIFHRMVDDDGFLRDDELSQVSASRLDANDNSFYKTLEANMRERLRSFKAGTRFFSELMIYDGTGNRDEAGTIDFLAIEPDNADDTAGKIHILDWKFLTLQTNATDVPWYKREAWNIQLSEYARILQTPAYGAAKKDFGFMRAIPIRARYFSDPPDNKLKLYSIEIGGVDVKAIPDDTLLPVSARGESTGSKELDELIVSLNNLSEKIYETRSDPGKEYLKIERLNDLVSAIRRLHVKRETEKLFEFANRDIRELNDFFRKYFDLLGGGDQHLIDALDINDLSRRILDAEDILSLYRELSKIFRKVFDPAASKPLLQEAEKISDNAEIVRGKLLDLAGLLRSNPIARGAGITDVLNPEKAVTWYQKWVRSLSQGATKATQILWNIVNAIGGKVALEFSDQISELKKLESQASGWIKAGGRHFRDLENLILARDSKGRWNGKVISKTDPAFYGALNAAKLKKDKTWVNENINLEEYKAWYEKELQDRKETYQHSRLHEDDTGDQEIKKKRLDEFALFFDIIAHPDTAISSANLKLNSYPDLEKWKSAAYKELLKPGNEPVLDLYNYWEKQLETSYRLGMIKAWERKTFFPNVRKDFLEAMVFGSANKAFRTANLGFLDSVRIDVNDQVFGYTDLNGNPADKLSALYVYDLGEKVTTEDGSEFTDYSGKSTDLFKVMALWANQMAKFKHKSDVVDTVRLLYLTEQNRKAIALSKKTGGISVRSDGSPVLIDNVENSQYFKNFMDYYFFGKRLSEGQDVTFNFHYNKLAGKVNTFFGSQLLPRAAEEEITVSGKKLIAATNRFFQMKTLGLNLATAVTNYVGGKANAYMLAGKYFTKTDYTSASFKMAGANFHTAEGKIYAGLLGYFLPLTDDRTRQQVRELSVSAAIRLFSSDHLFYLMRTSDKWVQYPAAIAFFDNTMVEEGQLRNIRDYVKQKNGYDGIYNLSKNEQNTLRQKIEKEIAELKNTRSLSHITTIENDKPVIAGIKRDSQTVYDLRNQIQQFAKDALGNMSEDDISQYRMTLLGQSFMMFKNWIPRMADVRFGEFRYQAGTDDYEWGRVSMLFNALRQGFLTGAAAALGTLVGNQGSMVSIARKMYETKKAEVEQSGEVFKMSEAEFIDMYIKGIRTQLKEVLLMASMMALLLFARSQAPDDDEDGRTSGAYKWLVRTVDKMSDELGFFYNPLSFTAIANGSVFPSVQILNDLVKLIRGLSLESFYLVTGDEQAREKNKVVKYLFKTMPVTKELMMYTAIFNEDLAKEYGITISTSARRSW